MHKRTSFLVSSVTTFWALTLTLQSGCGLLLGNIKPVDEKSDHYGVVDLSKDDPSVWLKLDDQEKGADPIDPEVTKSEVPDSAFQSKKTAAIVSINSSCRPNSPEFDDKDLRSLTNLLLLGLSEITHRHEKELTLLSGPALETTVQGLLSGSKIAMKTIVLKRQRCVYDLLYMASPSHFPENEKDFSRFVASLKLK